MAELTPRERLQPSLLDRLTDDDPEHAVEGRDRRVLSVRQLQQAVLRDLTWLLNSRARRAEDGLSEFPEVEASVLNFGMPDLTGSTVSGVSVSQLERQIVDTILRFEPRLIRDTITVTAVPESTRGGSPQVFGLEIKADLWAQPVPTHLYVRTEVDLETGQCTLKDRAHG
ncbi:MAG: type VI secretion system baseplate subunit TssE [Phycisphaerales bacterium]|nr:type VI secretion system baseplate subunit TssE [Phycisphaerales bacterium]